MKKSVYIGSLAGLALGMLVGYSFEYHQSMQVNVNQLNANLGQVSSYLNLAQDDLREATPNPTTSLEKAYEVNYKIAVAKASSIWDSIGQLLVQDGFSSSNVNIISTGLEVIPATILPPYGMSPTAPTVHRAHVWIAMLQTAIDLQNPSGNDYLARLKAHISSVVHKYESYKSDNNFAVPPIF